MAVIDSPDSYRLYDPYRLLQLTQSAARAHRPEEIYDAALQCLRDSLGVDRAAILLFDADGVMRFKAWLGLSAEYRRAVEGHTPWSPDTTDAEPVLVPDVLDEPSLAEFGDVFRMEGIRALAFLPLAVAGRLLGKFMLYYREPHEFAAEELLFAETIAANVAFAIDRRQVEDRLNIYAQVFRNSYEGLAIIAPDGKYLEQNAAHAELTGYSDGELVGETPAIHLGPEAFAAIAQELQQSGTYRGEVESVAKNGERRILDLLAFAVRDEDGRPSCYVGIKRDITRRKQAEQQLLDSQSALRESEQRFRFMADNSPGMIWMMGPDKGATYFSKGFLELTGRPLEAELGFGWADNLHPDDRDACLKDFIEACERGERFQREFRLKRRDGTYRWILAEAAPSHTPNGALVGFVGSMLDVTARREGEDRLREAAALRDQFLSLVSHELRTPIATIVGNGQLLSRRGHLVPEDARQQALTDIATEGERLQEIIENLLLLTRLEGGELDLEPVPLQRLAEEEVAKFRRRRPLRQFQLVGETGPALGQDIFVSLVIQNLLSNADKYSPQDRPIEVRLGYNAEGWPELRVKDYGMGLEEGDLDKIFSPFFRSIRTRGQAKGIGLGLAVCKRIVDVLGGQIGVESSLGQGAEFSFCLKPV